MQRSSRSALSTASRPRLRWVSLSPPRPLCALRQEARVRLTQSVERDVVREFGAVDSSFTCTGFEFTAETNTELRWTTDNLPPEACSLHYFMTRCCLLLPYLHPLRSYRACSRSDSPAQQIADHTERLPCIFNGLPLNFLLTEDAGHPRFVDGRSYGTLTLTFRLMNHCFLPLLAYLIDDESNSR